MKLARNLVMLTVGVAALYFQPKQPRAASLCQQLIAIASARQEIARLPSDDDEASDKWSAAHALTGFPDCSLTRDVDDAHFSCRSDRLTTEQADSVMIASHGEIERCLDQNWCRVQEKRDSRVNPRTGNRTSSVAYEYAHYDNRFLDHIRIEKSYVERSSDSHAWVDIDIHDSLKAFTAPPRAGFVANVGPLFSPDMTRRFDQAKDCHAFGTIMREQLQQDFQQGQRHLQQLQQQLGSPPGAPR